MIIAIDFDGTLCEFAYPRCGKPNKRVINKVKKNQYKHTFILWTARSGKLLKKAIKWCKEQGINFKYANMNDPRMLCYGDNRKIGADFYIDDKSPGSIEYFLKMKL